LVKNKKTKQTHFQNFGNSDIGMMMGRIWGEMKQKDL